MRGAALALLGVRRLSLPLTTVHKIEKINAGKDVLIMSPPSFLKKNVFSILFGLLFLVITFSAVACSSKKQPLLSACLTAEEKADLEYFLRLLIFENYGAFVLFGSKPLCEMNFSDTESTAAELPFQTWYASLPDDRRRELEAKTKRKTQAEPELERNLYRGWLAWEKVRKTFEMKHYILRVDPLRGQGHYAVILANIQQTALVLAENQEIFQNAAGMQFHPLQVVFELQNPESIFWKKIFSLPNHLAKGLLFGFGLRNSIFGNWHFSYSNAKVSSELGEHIVEYLKGVPSAVSTNSVKFGKGSPSNFTIPLFGTIPGDDMVDKYTKEKSKIEKIYRGQDLVEVTLQRLASY